MTMVETNVIMKLIRAIYFTLWFAIALYLFRCNSGPYIGAESWSNCYPAYMQCDGNTDCYDTSDEFNCGMDTKSLNNRVFTVLCSVNQEKTDGVHWLQWGFVQVMYNYVRPILWSAWLRSKVKSHHMILLALEGACPYSECLFYWRDQH